uniref:Phospholipid-transporting ATPase n=1 Tax=Palpitomonas bilix TaxID=652834 RepID=A0A7S3LVN7_9EUKA|mmetsp:Transcript_49780/g.128074  ORF Transcript_49780/g.128074 Transcript_49780/m.128074 type:complete len:824 (+) Transcript_49780:1-2472(+)
MYYEEKDAPCLCRTSNLNEDLGQIEYIFSDKTGTLTRNEMEFRKCAINGKVYGFGTTEIGEAAMKAAASSGQVVNNSDGEEDASHLANIEEAQYEIDRRIHFDDPRLLARLNSMDAKDEDDKVLINEFLTLLSVCHTVIPEVKEGQLCYQAASPDEGALVSAARCLGYKFNRQLPGGKIEVLVRGNPVEYEILGVNEFNSTRKRMSVICRCPDGSVTLYCKGADNIIFERLLPTIEKRTTDKLTGQLETFGSEGLRTLVLAKRVLSPSEFADWKAKFDEASTSLTDREEKLMDIAEEIEKDMELVGATAIEDKLQAGVPDAIANLASGGLKIWVLTGDKQETAINIGYACNLLNNNMEKMIINEDDPAAAESIINQQLAALSEHRGKTLEHLSLIIDGPTLTKISEEDDCRAEDRKIKPKLLELAKMCKAVVACRVSPSQKAEIVSLVKNGVKPEPLTLSIGDGANDVTMIQTAHVGIGISGNEGMQAVNNSDYAIAQFRYLERLLLVHGRNNYKRAARAINYIFYKNVMNTLVLFLFCFFNGFSGSSLYESLTSAAYNVVWTSLPVIVLGIIDKDVSPKHALESPLLYKVGQWKLDFSVPLFVKWVFNALIHACIIYFFSMFIFNTSAISSAMTGNGLYIFGTMTYASVVITVNYKIALETFSFTLAMHIVTWGSILVFLLVVVVYSVLPISNDFAYIGVVLMTLGGFWMAIILVPVTACLIDYTHNYIKQAYFPDPQNIVRERAMKRKERKFVDGDTPRSSFKVVASTKDFSSATPHIASTIGGRRATLEHHTGFDYSHPERSTSFDPDAEKRHSGTPSVI